MSLNEFSLDNLKFLNYQNKGVSIICFYILICSINLIIKSQWDHGFKFKKNNNTNNRIKYQLNIKMWWNETIHE